jgi:proprotein convertase subtilisin/kexin type 5
VNGTANDFFLVQQTTICSTLCPDGQYGNKTTHTCMFCNINCKTCENTSTTCMSCGFSSIGANLYLLANQCLLACPDTYFSDETTNKCVTCHLGCALCFGPAITQCTKCKT